MKHHAWRYILSILFLSLLVVGPAATPIKASPAKAQAAKTAPATGAKSKKVEAPKPKSDWDGLVAAAKKEGVVVICSSVGSQVRNEFSKAMTDKYGVKLEEKMGPPYQESL